MNKLSVGDYGLIIYYIVIITYFYMLQSELHRSNITEAKHSL